MNINLTLIGQSISFLFFVAFCMKFVWPAITNAMAERQKLIADGLEAADRASRDLELAQQKAMSQMAEAKHDAAGIIEQANKRANKIIEEAEVKAQDKAAGILTAAEANVEQEVNRAKEQLRSQVATLAIAGAEKILESSVDAAAHKVMLDNLASEL
ncbi:MAG: F0F1 ATP synthase subunit B [Pseudomonadales bacterium]|nr:F0F1 ATP synthase subunit B [Pseudomonadales bacterium]